MNHLQMIGYMNNTKFKFVLDKTCDSWSSSSLLGSGTESLMIILRPFMRFDRRIPSDSSDPQPSVSVGRFRELSYFPLANL